MNHPFCGMSSGTIAGALAVDDYQMSFNISDYDFNIVISIQSIVNS